ncbi:MAG: HAMP domain-containing sensor histidine kinase [Nitrospira sp.]
MSALDGHAIRHSKEAILTLWEKRCLKEVTSARITGPRALRDSLPTFLDRLDEALAAHHKMDATPVAILEQEAIRVGKMHGVDRACNTKYTLGEVIDEYHILRQVIFHILERDGPLAEMPRDILLDSIEQAVKNAVLEFTQAHSDIQEKFIHTLTHDLRTPISVAKMNAALAVRGTGIPDSAKEFIKRNVVSLNRLDSMIEDLLDASRLRAGECLTLQYHQCDLDTVLRGVLEEMIVVHGPRFMLDSPTAVEGRWGRDALRRAVENLIDNAVKYGAKQTPITVSLKTRGRMVEVCVHNEGSFIPEHEIPRLFEKFRRAQHSQQHAQQQGWGLRLTLVKAIVDDHKGKIRVESERDFGTRFILELPILVSPSSQGA